MTERWKPSWKVGWTDGSLVSSVGRKIISLGKTMAVPSGMPDQTGQKRGGTDAVAFEVIGIGVMKVYGGGDHDGDIVFSPLEVAWL